MNIRTCTYAVLAATCIGLAGSADAQDFTSVSSIPTTQGGTTPASLTERPAAPAAAPGTAPVQSFSSVSSLPSTPEAAGPAAVAPVAPATPASGEASLVPAPAPAAPAPGPATAPTALAFSSVSSLGSESASATGSGPLLPASPSQADAGAAMADRIVVEKGARRLLLLRGGDVLAAYPVKLGLNPKGHKRYEGDFRTPEGTYYLSRRNPRSEFFLSLEVSYPNEVDRERARREGVRPGGLIMIHGQPNVRRKPPEYYALNDWTNGCIAVSNADMVDIWERTRIGTPIEIRP